VTPSLQTARDAARGRLLTLLAGLFAVGALVYTARNHTLSQRTLELQRRTFDLTRQGQVTDRYTKAIEQLGSEQLDVRIGGIYALEHVARDSARDHPTVMEVLTAFIREHSHDQWPPVPSSRMTRIIRRGRFWASGRNEERSTRPDIQAALGVIGRRVVGSDIRDLDLRGADLSGADLSGAILTNVRLDDAKLIGAKLVATVLDYAWLPGVNLTGANLGLGFDPRYPIGHRLIGADLTGANLDHARLSGANLTSAPHRRKTHRRGLLWREPRRRQMARKYASSGRLEAKQLGHLSPTGKGRRRL
jgi:hypothetical protein